MNENIVENVSKEDEDIHEKEKDTTKTPGSDTETYPYSVGVKFQIPTQCENSTTSEYEDIQNQEKYFYGVMNSANLDVKQKAAYSIIALLFMLKYMIKPGPLFK